MIYLGGSSITETRNHTSGRPTDAKGPCAIIPACENQYLQHHVASSIVAHTVGEFGSRFESATFDGKRHHPSIYIYLYFATYGDGFCFASFQ
jgi:hypothetical protein